MYHYVNAVTNTKGDALIGYYVKAVDSVTGNTASLYADANSTPIVSVSGVANAAKVDSDGNASFYIAGGQYHLDIYATDATTFVRRISNIPMVDFTVAAGNVVDRTTLAAKSAANGDVWNLTETGREGLFIFDSSNLSTQVTNDPNQGIYVAPTSAPTGVSGAWKRVQRDIVNAFWFMSAAQVADVRAFGYTQNVTTALKAASAYIQYLGGGVLLLPPGGYLVGVQTRNGLGLDGVTVEAYAPSEILTIKNCTKPVKISGYGAVLKLFDGAHFGSFDPATGNVFNPSLPFTDASYIGSPYRGMLNLDGNTGGVAVEGLELDGNNTKLALGGYWGDSQWQIEGHGIWCRGNGFVHLRDLSIHNQPCDGLVLNTTTIAESTALPPVVVENVRCRYNARQGLSLTGGKGLLFRNCDFSNTGQAFNTVTSVTVQSAPGCGVDIEPSPTMVRDAIFENCTVLGNWGGGGAGAKGFAAASGDSRRIRVIGGKIENPLISRPEYVFDGVKIIGYHSFGLTNSDQYKAASQGVTLTIASLGGGSYSITRSAGSFVTDGFSVGSVSIMPSVFAGSTVNSGLNAGNKDKRLLVTALTATVMTVTPFSAGTLVAEGPIANCWVATATQQRDRQVLKHCRITYDASETESGSLINSTQGDMSAFLFGLYDDCRVYTGNSPLPNFNIAGNADETFPLVINSRFVSSSGTAANLFARFQGYNYIDAPSGTVNVNVGTRSRVETGNVFLNGTGLGSVGFTASSGAALLVPLTGDAGQYKYFSFQDAGVEKWELGQDSSTNFYVYRASGTTVEFSISNSTGNATFAHGVTAASITTSGTGTISAGGSIKSSGTGGVGYGTGAGGTVTQLTSKSTGVTLNKDCGAITMNNAALAATTSVSFTLTNSEIAADDAVFVWCKSGFATAATYRAWSEGNGAGSRVIVLRNESAGSLSEAVVLGFAIQKAVTA